MNLIMKMLAAPATVLALWAVSARCDQRRHCQAPGACGPGLRPGPGMQGHGSRRGSGRRWRETRTRSSPSTVMPATARACWVRRKLATPPHGKNAPTIKVALMASWPRPSPVSTPCRLKAPALIARMTTSRVRSRRCPGCNRPIFAKNAAYERLFVPAIYVLRLFIAAKTRQARSNSNSWNVREQSDGAVVFNRASS